MGSISIHKDLLICWLVEMRRLYDIIPDGNNFVDFSRPIGERNKPEPNGTFGSLVII